MKHLVLPLLFLGLLFSQSGCTDSKEPSGPPQDPTSAINEAIRGLHLLIDNQIDKPGPALLAEGGLRGAYVVAGDSVSSDQGTVEPTDEGLRRALEALFHEYPKAKPDDVMYGFFEGMTRALNERHTVYLRPEPWQDLSLNQRPYFGYSATTIPEGRLVWRVDPGSPSDQAGIKAGDVITAINNLSLADSNTLISPVVGRTDSFSLRSPDGKQRTANVTATTAESPIEGRMLTGGIAYVRISSFVPSGSSEIFTDQLDATMKQLAVSSPAGWILDLRSNGGGLVNLAAYTAGWFGFEGLFAESIVRDDARASRPLGSVRQQSLNGRPLAILLNKRSASSSEMIAEVLRAAGIARIVGETSAGSVRLAQYHEVGGGALQIAFADVTVGPTRSRLNLVGITPQYPVPLDPRDLANGTDAQLDRAIALVSGD